MTMDDPVMNTKYQKYKYKVKRWEKEFKEKNGRVPSKLDIREAPSAIRDSYKMYYKLKTSFLEETLSDALEDDSFDLSILESSSQTNSPAMADRLMPDVSALTSDSFILLPSSTSDMSAVTVSPTDSTEPVPSVVSKMSVESNGSEFEAAMADTINDKAWGEELNNHSSSSQQSQAAANNKFTRHMSSKLFRNASFAKRNPRKSLSRNSFGASQSSQSLQSLSQREALPDLEAILSQKSRQAKENTENTEPQTSQGSMLNGTVPVGKHIDHSWLDRCNDLNGLADGLAAGNAAANEAVPPAHSQPHSQPLSQSMSQPQSTPRSFGISNINTSALAALRAEHSEAAAVPKTMLSFGMHNMSLRASDSFGDGSANASAYNDDNDEEVANSEDESLNESKPQIRSARHSLKRKYVEIAEPAPVKGNGGRTLNGESGKVAIEQRRPIVSIRRRGKGEAPAAAVEVAPVKRRSSRNPSQKAKNYSETNGCGADDLQPDEPEAFACDDSDNDPNFTLDAELKSQGSARRSPSVSSDDDRSEPAAPAKVAAKPRPKSVRTRTARVAARPTRAAKSQPPTAPKSVRARKSVTGARTAPPAPPDDDVEPATVESPDDYLLEFGVGTLRSTPSIALAELRQNSEEFSKYLAGAAGSAPTSAPSNRAAKSKASVVCVKSAIAKDKLEKKVAAGTLNDNYVRLNLRKKVFVRGKKTINFSRYKKKLWKSKKAAALSGPDMDMGGCDGGILTCFQCGMPGHFAQNCKIQSDRLLPLDAQNDDSPFPTLEEAAEMSKQKIAQAHGSREVPKASNPSWDTAEPDAADAADAADAMADDQMARSDEAAVAMPTRAYIGHEIPEDFLIKAGLLNNNDESDDTFQPLYRLNADGTTIDTPPEVYEALALFGHSQFRSGQEKAVMRILSGQSTLVTLSTGSGKSLCYQLPAYLFARQRRCITLVISPLVSLMEDQVHGVPHFLNAHCLHTNLSARKRDQTIEALRAGQVDVLLISPEAVVASEKSNGFGSILRDLPPIAFVCIDEAHCVSQWSHNFRPSYLMVCRVLYEKLKVKTVLGLTATATLSTRQSIVEHLCIPDGLNGVISDIPVPDNLTLTVSSDENRDYALIQLLQEQKFVDFQSIIVYCSRRDQCERVAKNLRTYFQDDISRELNQRNSSGKRKRAIKTTIEPYHAGMAPSRRRTIQNAFMRGDLKIVVATIAFGMGINKADIRCVIHYNMPMNFESYVQEVGRAGRDGKHAHCHLFLDSRNEDKVELRRHIYANSIDRHCIRKLLEKIFVPCACKKAAVDGGSIEADIAAAQNIDWNDDPDEETTYGSAKKGRCPGHEVCFSVEETINELDIPEENIATLLCYLELHDQKFVKTLSKAYMRCKVYSYGGPKSLKDAALRCPPLAMAIALDMRKGVSHDKSSLIQFPVIEIASAIGWNSGVVKYQLKQLEWTKDNKRSNISVEFFDLGFRVLAPGDLSPSEQDSTLNLLYSRVKGQENNQLAQLENVFHGLSTAARRSALLSARVEPNDDHSEQLKRLIRAYFQSTTDPTPATHAEQIEAPAYDESIAHIIVSDIRTMIGRYPENNFTGRSLARIFHGVQSPVFPAVIWSRCKHWRAHLKIDFNYIVHLANIEILRLRT